MHLQHNSLQLFVFFCIRTSWWWLRTARNMLNEHISLLTLLNYLLTYSMQQSTSWEANWFSASQEIPRILWNPKAYYRIHTCPPHVLTLSHINQHPTSWRYILILSSHLRLCLPSGLFLSRFPTKTLYTPLLFPISATCPLISFFSIWSPEQYWARSTDHNK